MDEVLHQRLKQVAARQGFDLDELAAKTPSPLDPAGWVLDDPVGFRLDMVRKILRHEADGEFQPERLPPLNDRVARFIEMHRQDPEVNNALLLYGATGAGKTSQGIHVVIELATWAAQQNRTYRWRIVSHREFAAQTRAWHDDPDGAIERYKDCDLLLFDDLGAYNATAFAADCTYRLIDHRYRRKLATVYTTNMLFTRTESVAQREKEMGMTIPVLADSLDDRAISRLRATAKIDLGKIDHRAAMGTVIA